MTLTAAVAQFAPSEDKAANLDTIVDLLRQAADQNADLVVLPEYAVFTVPTMDDRFVRTAEALDGSSVTRLAQAGAELGLTVIAGINESAGNGKIHNTLVGIQGGEIAAVYRKVHLYDAFGYKESDRVIAADPAIPQLLRVNGFTIGMQTCYDLRFPETSRALVDAGADVIALPAEWVPRAAQGVSLEHPAAGPGDREHRLRCGGRSDRPRRFGQQRHPRPDGHPAGCTR